MNVRRTARRATDAFLGRLGYALVTQAAEQPTMSAALRRRARHATVGSVVDVGASDGSWSILCSNHFPSADYLLIEAQENPHAAALHQLSSERSNFDYVIAAAGDAVGTARFDASDPFGGVITTQPGAGGDLSVPMTTIDVEVARRRLPPPYLVKLDTHGFEVPILHGGTTTLAATSILVVEVYNFTLQPGALTFYEMCTFLGDLGLRPIDVADPMYRPSDGVLWQMDMFFAPRNAAEFTRDTFE